MFRGDGEIYDRASASDVLWRGRAVMRGKVGEIMVLGGRGGEGR